MSAVKIRQNNMMARLSKRREEVNSIVSSHSKNLFGHSQASIKEIRNEAIQRLVVK